MSLDKSYGLKTYLMLDPLTSDRTAPSIPTAIEGTSFADPNVQAAFTQQAMAYAALKPAILGLGAEVNVLALSNPTEFNNYVTMVKQTYQAVKAAYPSQIIDISFQYDVMRSDTTQQQFNLLGELNSALDEFAFTTYPHQFVGNISNLPSNYYSILATQLQRQGLTKPLGFSEIGWDAITPAEEVEQNEFVQEIPSLFLSLNPQFLDFALLTDVNNLFPASYSYLNNVGLFASDGAAKPAWTSARSLTY